MSGIPFTEKARQCHSTKERVRSDFQESGGGRNRDDRVAPPVLWELQHRSPLRGEPESTGSDRRVISPGAAGLPGHDETRK